MMISQELYFEGSSMQAICMLKMQFIIKNAGLIFEMANGNWKNNSPHKVHLEKKESHQ